MAAHLPSLAASAVAPFPEHEIIRRINACPKLASLQSINRALDQLIRGDATLNSQIASVIRRDPSLAARLLRMVNSVYSGLSTRMNNLEEAVFFLGVRQIRELSLATQVIEELAQLQPTAALTLPWKELWAHSISTAIITREILANNPFDQDDDTDYLVGLLHNVGKVVMAYAFPEALPVLIPLPATDPADVCLHERQLIGWDHARIGAHFLARHQLSDEIVTAVHYHHTPADSPRHTRYAAAVQVADYLVRHAGITGGFENIAPIATDAWLDLPGWKILFASDAAAASLTLTAITPSLRRLPSLLQTML
jgi:HD-like signal output (HDOD) protein